MRNRNNGTPVLEGIYALANLNLGITVLNVKCECNLFGRKTYFNMTSFEIFAIINGVPVEKEMVKEKEGSWWRNFNNVTIYNVSELSAIEVSSTINSSDHTF